MNQQLNTTASQPLRLYEGACPLIPNVSYGRNSHQPLAGIKEIPHVLVYLPALGPGHIWLLSPDSCPTEGDSGTPALGTGVKSWDGIKSLPILRLMMNMQTYSDKSDQSRGSRHSKDNLE